MYIHWPARSGGPWNSGLQHLYDPSLPAKYGEYSSKNRGLWQLRDHSTCRAKVYLTVIRFCYCFVQQRSLACCESTKHGITSGHVALLDRSLEDLIGQAASVTSASNGCESDDTSPQEGRREFLHVEDPKKRNLSGPPPPQNLNSFRTPFRRFGDELITRPRLSFVCASR